MKFITYFAILLIVLLRYQQSLPVFKNGDFIKITSKIYSEPIVYDDAQYVKIKGLKIYLPKYPEVNYGDNIVVVGQVSEDKLVSPKLIEITQKKSPLYIFREKLISFYKSSLPEPYSSLVAGIVIGSKNMPQSFWDKLKLTGTAHVVVASGTNVALTIGFLINSLTLFLNRKKAIYITYIGIICYMFMSGFEAPIIRASLMGSILLFGQEKGRVVNSWRILLYSGLIMLLIKPSWITDIGFILSFTATGSMMLFEKSISTRLKMIPAVFREGLSTSLAAQIGVAPILYMTFGQFNLLSPVINALILWTIPYIMIGGAVAGLVGIFVPLVGRLILFVLYPLLYYFVKLIELFT